MALVKCQECNKEISDQASNCPHCGCPIVSYTYCSNCGANVINGNICSNCGKPLNNVKNTMEMNSFALAGGILSISSCFIDFIGLNSACGVVLSAIGLSQVKSKKQRGKGWAITGIVVGIFEFILKMIMMYDNFYL